MTYFNISRHTLKKTLTAFSLFSIMLLTSPIQAKQIPGATPKENKALALPHYDIKLQINPETSHIAVHMTLSLSPKSNSLEFLLHRQFNHLSVTGSAVNNWQFMKDARNVIPWIPEGKPLVIHLNHPDKKQQTIQLSINYEGTITQWPPWSANVLHKSWTEAGVYFPWFPFSDHYSPFTYQVAVTYPESYEITGSGKSVKNSGTWLLTSEKPCTDIVIVLSPSLNSVNFETESYSAYVHYITLSKITANHILNDLKWMLKTFNSWFGSVPYNTITLLESKRQKGGGYSNDGFISLSGLSDNSYNEKYEEYIRYLSHETSHLWWNHATADSWEDWLNEGFAEYSAMLAVKEKFGESSFNNLLNKKSERIKNTPRLWKFNRHDNKVANTILYSKAPIILHALSTHIGQTRFLELCRAIHEHSINNTDSFLQFLETIEGKPTRNWFEQMLHKKKLQQK